MFVEVHTPEYLTGRQLDAYLARGWFRMGQTVFTTNFAHVKDTLLSTIWLRVKLNAYQPDGAYLRLQKRYANFSVHIKPAEITPEKEELFSRYRESLPFSISESLRHLLLGNEDTETIYTTYEVTVHDQEKLIACGFFDLGEASAEGIVSFYDPAYRKLSPGKFIIYAKMHYCQQLGFKYFYPGYFVPGNPYFDYKLSIGRKALEYLQVGSGLWASIEAYSETDIPVRVMEFKLMEVVVHLAHAGIPVQLQKYEFFDAAMIPQMRESELLDFPMFVYVGNLTQEPVTVLAVYDVRDEQFHVLHCVPLWKPDRTNPDASFYSSYFLKPVQEIFKTPDAYVTAGLLNNIAKQVML